MVKEQQSPPIDLFWLSLYAFLGIGLELALLLAEALIYGHSVDTFSRTQHILHLLLTSLVWIAVAVLLVRVARGRHNLDIFMRRTQPSIKQLNIVLLISIVHVTVTSLVWRGLKPIIEFQNLGAVLFGFQILYYLAEATLITLIVAFAQEAGDRQFKTHRVPWGGLVAGASWGLVHLFTQGSVLVGLYGFGLGMAYGTIYLALNKNGRAYGVIALLFIL